jgi:Ca-activated chloride channel family protein
VVHGDSLGADGGDFPVKIINGEKGRIPGKGHLLLLDPASSQQLVSVTGTTSVNGNVSGDPKHPLMQQVPLKEIHIADVKRVNVPEWAHVVLRSGDTPLILAGEQMGRRVVLFTFALDKSDLPLQPGFPVLMVQVMNWLAPASGASGSRAKVGEEIQLPLPPWVQQVKIQNPSSESETIRAAGGILRFTPERTGLYQLSDARKKEWIHYVTVPFPEEESRIAPQTVPTAAFQGNKTAVEGEQELWWWVAFLSLAAVGLEWVVFSRGY